MWYDLRLWTHILESKSFQKNLLQHKLNCIIECDRGSFGVACNELCGQCLDVNQCFHTNGTCLTGCIAGFKGDLCKTRE